MKPQGHPGEGHRRGQTEPEPSGLGPSKSQRRRQREGRHGMTGWERSIHPLRHRLPSGVDLPRPGPAHHLFHPKGHPAGKRDSQPSQEGGGRPASPNPNANALHDGQKRRRQRHLVIAQAGQPAHHVKPRRPMKPAVDQRGQPGVQDKSIIAPTLALSTPPRHQTSSPSYHLVAGLRSIGTPVRGVPARIALRQGSWRITLPPPQGKADPPIFVADSAALSEEGSSLGTMPGQPREVRFGTTPRVGSSLTSPAPVGRPHLTCPSGGPDALRSVLPRTRIGVWGEPAWKAERARIPAQPLPRRARISLERLASPGPTASGPAIQIGGSAMLCGGESPHTEPGPRKLAARSPERALSSRPGAGALRWAGESESGF